MEIFPLYRKILLKKSPIWLSLLPAKGPAPASLRYAGIRTAVHFFLHAIPTYPTATYPRAGD